MQQACELGTCGVSLCWASQMRNRLSDLGPWKPTEMHCILVLCPSWALLSSEALFICLPHSLVCVHVYVWVCVRTCVCDPHLMELIRILLSSALLYRMKDGGSECNSVADEGLPSVHRPGFDFPVPPRRKK